MIFHLQWQFHFTYDKKVHIQPHSLKFFLGIGLRTYVLYIIHFTSDCLLTAIFHNMVKKMSKTIYCGNSFANIQNEQGCKQKSTKILEIYFLFSFWIRKKEEITFRKIYIYFALSPKKFWSYHLLRTLVRAGGTDATAPYDFGQLVHAPVRFQGCFFFHNFFYIFLLISKSCTCQMKYLTRALLLLGFFNKPHLLGLVSYFDYLSTYLLESAPGFYWASWKWDWLELHSVLA